MAELRIGSATDKGRVRPENEDNLLITGTAFVVADGMGGHEAGEVASQIAVDGIRERLAAIAASRTADQDGEEDEPVATLPTASEFVRTITSANTDIFRTAIANPSQRGMGTTVTAIAVIADPLAGRGAPNVGDSDEGDAPGDTEAPTPGNVTPVKPVVPSEALVLANVGDSRTYLFRHGRLRRVTVDHSYVQELVATGHISEDEARVHPRRNIITRALGIEPDVRVDWWTLPLIRGDRFVLCSDGLVDEVADADITTILLDTADPQVAAEALVDAANAAGGRDNITVIVVDVLEGDDPPDPTLEIDVVPTWADAGTPPTPAGPFALDPDAPADPTGPLERTAAAGDGTGSQRSGIAKFAIGFAAAAAVVVGRGGVLRPGRGAATTWRSTATVRRSSTAVATAACSGSTRRPRRPVGRPATNSNPTGPRRSTTTPGSTPSRRPSTSSATAPRPPRRPPRPHRPPRRRRCLRPRPSTRTRPSIRTRQGAWRFRPG